MDEVTTIRISIAFTCTLIMTSFGQSREIRLSMVGGKERGETPPQKISRRNYPSWSGAENRDKDRDTLIEQSQY